MKLGVFVRLLVAIALLPLTAYSLPPQINGVSVPKLVDDSSYFDANRLFMLVGNTGNIAYDNAQVFGRNDGLYYPYTGYTYFPGNKTMVFAAGLVLGGKVGGQIRIAAADYSHEYVPGPMINGTFQPDQPSFRVYKIDQSSGPGDPDYDGWPASEGAPVDQYGNPLLLGQQTLWAVFNDADPAQHFSAIGATDPLGVEVQQTVWGADVEGEQIVLYLKYKLYNKGANPIDSFFISFWSDPDLGSSSDDMVGCDTARNIFFAYNAGDDPVYYPDSPVWGLKLLSGPVVAAPGDTAIFDGQSLPNFRNLGMYSFNRYINGTDPYSAQETYNYMKGLTKAGSPIVDPYGYETKFVYSGDPAANTGWLDPDAGDKRLMASFGPLTFYPGDSQQIILKMVAYAGSDLPAAVTELKQALDSAAVVVNPPVYVEGDSVQVSVTDYQKLSDVYFVSPPYENWLAGCDFGGSFFGGGAFYGNEFFGSSINPDANPELFHNVEVRFSPTETQKAYCYLRGGSPNYGYVGYFDCPFTVWDTDNNRQLNAAFVENVGSGCQDNTWGPCGMPDGGREYLLIFASDYSGNDPTNNPIGYQNLNLMSDADLFDIQYVVTPKLRSGHTLDELADGQKLVFRKQTLNPNGVASQIQLQVNELGAGVQKLVVSGYSQANSILEFNIPPDSPFRISPTSVIFDAAKSFNTTITFAPPSPGVYTDDLRIVDISSGVEKAQVRLVGLPLLPQVITMTIEPNPMLLIYANAVNPMPAKIHLGEFLQNEHLLEDIDTASIMVNDTIKPSGVELLSYYPGFNGKVLEITFPIRGFLLGYGLTWDSNNETYTLSGQFSDESPLNLVGDVTIVGHRSGDANDDGDIDIADATFLISYIFSGGRQPRPLLLGDANCDGEVSISDVIYLINYVFAGGPQPCIRK